MPNTTTLAYMDVSKNSGIPKLSILIGFSFINHPFWGTLIFGNTHIYIYVYMYIHISVCHGNDLEQISETTKLHWWHGKVLLYKLVRFTVGPPKSAMHMFSL